MWGEQYAKRADAFAGTDRWRSEVQSVLGWLPNRGKVLDLGCNTGTFIGMAQAKRPYNTYVGMDINKHGTQVAAERYPFAEFVNSLEDLGPKESYNTVVIIHALSQIKNRTETMLAVWDILKRGGILVILAHNPIPAKLRVKNLFNGYKSDDTISWEPRLGELRQFIWEHGFIPSHEEYIGRGLIRWLKPRLLMVGRKAG